MELSLGDFAQDCNPVLEAEIGRNRYILLSDLVPLLSLAKNAVSVHWDSHSIETPGAGSAQFDRSFFSNLFSCPPPGHKTGCTCCSPIRGVSLYGIGPLPSSVSHKFQINGVERAFSMFKGSCPLFNGSCSLGGSAEKFYKSVPLPCALSPGWSVRIRGKTVFIGRKMCRHGQKIKYSEGKFREDSIVLERIAGFLHSLSLEPAFSMSDLRKAFESQLL